jgi:hypothetical protein
MVAPVKRRRPGLIAVLVLVGVLALCGGIAGTAAYVSTTEFTTGASTPQEAVTGYLTGVYLHQEASEAEAYLCQRADPNTLAKRMIRDARTETDKYQAVFSWSGLHYVSETDTSATISTYLTSTGPQHNAVTLLTLTTIKSDGWWVCGVTSNPN